MRPPLLALGLMIAAGCTPKQDPGVPLPPRSTAATLGTADAAVEKPAATIAAIDAARRVVADNVANADTTGYRAGVCRVTDGEARLALNGAQGSLESTDRPLDVAVSGEGFFRVRVDPGLGDGFAYTRGGALFRDPDGQFVLGGGDGRRLEPPVVIPGTIVDTDLVISGSGEVSARVPGETGRTVLGRINLYRFTDPSALRPIDAGLYQATVDSGPAIECRPRENGVGRLQQNYLEASNVNLTREKLRDEFLARWRQQVLASAASR